jgi:pimeloyl-ACP methyl ester carboxylesterase
MVRKEFNVDENRMYLMGHFMGGAGTCYLASKYPDLWAAIGPIAPAAMGMTQKEINMNNEYKEYPGLSHGPIIADVYSFFAKHTKPARSRRCKR